MKHAERVRRRFSMRETNPNILRYGREKGMSTQRIVGILIAASWFAWLLVLIVFVSRLIAAK